MKEGIEMRNIQQRLTGRPGEYRAHLIVCGLAALLASGCAWDGNELPAKAAEARSAAPQASTQASNDQGVQIHRLFEIAKRQAVVADLPAQF
jgi:hypothetical protein